MPGQKQEFYVDMLERKGFKTTTTSALLYQMIRQGQIKRDFHGSLTTASNEYAPIKLKKIKRVQEVEQPRQVVLVKRRVAPKEDEGIAALPTQDAPRKAVQRSLLINNNWDAQKEVDKLSVMQARALYDLLKTIFGG
jgi:hypothetical protein